MAGYVAAPNAPNEWLPLPLTIASGSVTMTLGYGFAEGGVSFLISANVPPRALRVGLSGFDGWLLRIVVDT